jgi:hypothetical protein
MWGPVACSFENDNEVDVPVKARKLLKINASKWPLFNGVKKAVPLHEL